MITRRGLLGYLPLGILGFADTKRDKEELEDCGALTLDEEPIVLWAKLPENRGYRLKTRDREGKITRQVVQKLDLEGWTEWILKEV